jgi:hypothetical protein
LGVSGLSLVIRRWTIAHKHLNLKRNIIAFLPLVISYLVLACSGLWGIFDSNALVAVESARGKLMWGVAIANMVAEYL